MPRKIDPHRGDDGFGDVEPVSLTADQAGKLAAILEFAPDSPQASDIHFAVRDIGTIYRNWRRRGAAAFTRGEARKALEEILRTDRIDYAALTSLNGRAFQCVHDSLLVMTTAPVSRGDTVIAALMKDRLDEKVLRDAVLAAIERLKESKGPDREGDIAWAVEELCQLYEDLTGRAATHSNKGKLLAYQSGSQSQTGRFVKGCIELIDPRIRETQISRAMRLCIESRKKGRD